MGHHSWFDLFLHDSHHYIHVVMAGVTFTFLAIFSLAALGSLRKRADARIPDEKFTMANVAELAVGGLANLCDDIIGHDGHKYLWLMAPTFLYIFVANMLGVIPGFLPPTDNINTNLAVSGVIFIGYNIYGIKENGLSGYLKHMMGPVIFIAPLFFVIELVSHLVRPASLAIRLYGNIFGDHLVIAIFSDLVKLVVPAVFLGVGTFVSFIQALVFTLLSMVYIALATAHDH